MKAFFIAHPRLAGALLMLFNGLLIRFLVWSPLEFARSGAGSFSVPGFKAVGFFVAMFFLGGWMVLLGPALGRGDKVRGLTPLSWAVLGLSLALAIGFYVWYQRQFQALGYTAGCLPGLMGLSG